MTEKRCINCMSLLPTNATVCPVCGQAADENNAAEYLKAGIKVGNRYSIGKVLSYSGATVRYMAFDEQEYMPVYVYEYLPKGLCFRDDSGCLNVSEPNRDAYQKYLSTFRHTYRSTARLRDLSLMLPIFDIFEENNTVYAIGEYMEPQHTLSEILKQKGGRLTWEETRRLFLPFLSSLISCHAAGLRHYAICPTNLLVGDDGQLRLIGFDIEEIRQKNNELDCQLSNGYSAPEQYRESGLCNASTDVYGFCAVLFRVLSGNEVPYTREPNGNDLLLASDIAETLPSHVTAAISDGLQPQQIRRISSLAELRERLTTGAVVHALADEAMMSSSNMTEQFARPLTEEKEPKKKNMLPWILAGSIVLVMAIICAIIVIVILNSDKNKQPDNSNPTSSIVDVSANEDSLTETTTTVDAFTTKVPDLSNGNVDFYTLSISSSRQVYQGFAIELDGYKYSDSVEPGFIVSQEPAAGEMATAETVIHVYVSAGKQVTSIPDVAGWKADQAKLYLEALGFRVTISDETNANVPIDHVVGTWPSAGNEPDAGKGNKVTLRVNKYGTTAPETSTTAFVDSEAGQP